MAAPANKMAGPKKSFASVAAMAPPTQPKHKTSKVDDKTAKSVNLVSAPLARIAVKENVSPASLVNHLAKPLSRLGLKNDLSIVDGGLNSEAADVLHINASFEDEKTQLSSSTKPPSLDGKSVASATTFAMDEKESLRPDDSASLKAVEEDDSNSGHASGAPSSRIGSEAEGKAFRDQFNEISERIGPAIRPSQLNRRNQQGSVEDVPQGPLPSLPSAIPAVGNMPRPEMLPGHAVPQYNYQEPDEKLIEALDSPKDRLFLLQLEQQVISFIRDSQEPVLDLPPCNSFCRLLAHRLGDYYALTHYVDNAVSAVRLYRTPFCRLPNSLSTFSRQQANPDGASSAQRSMKIMRRAGLGIDGQTIESGPNTAASSLGASKAGSETGDESQRVSGVTSPTDSAVAKDKSSMTREEREAKYKETRERIFGGPEDVQNPETVQVTDPVSETSRTSSASGKKKSKRNKNNDDDFQARSSYNAYWPTPQYSGTAYNQANTPATYYNPYLQPTNGQIPPTGITQVYNQPYQTIPQYQPYQISVPQVSVPGGSVAYPQNFAYPQNSGSQPYTTYAQPIPQQFFTPMPQQHQMVSPSPAISSPALSNNGQLSRPQSQMSDQHWSQNGFHNTAQYPVFNGQQATYQPQGPLQMPSHTVPANISAGTYQFGQLPFQTNPQSARSQHPLPGSYQRQTFNPQTRAFVPGIPPLGPPQSTTYVNRPAEIPSYRPNQGFQVPTGITPFVQPSTTNLHPISVPQPGQYIPTASTQGYSTTQTQRKSTGHTPGSQSPGQSSLSKWARPENLPPKPPPSEASSRQNSGAYNGQGMPKFLNGTYSKPTTGSQVT